MAKRLSLFILLTLIASLNFLSACATMPEQKDLEISLRKTVKKYWDIRLTGDLEELYDMEYSEDLPPFDQYEVKAALIRKFIIRKNIIKKVTIEEKNAAVVLEQHIILPPLPEPLKQAYRDKWIWDGKWKHIFRHGKKKPEKGTQ